MILMNVENIMLSERRQTQKTTRYMVPSYVTYTAENHANRKSLSGGLKLKMETGRQGRDSWRVQSLEGTVTKIF